MADIHGHSSAAGRLKGPVQGECLHKQDRSTTCYTHSLPMTECAPLYKFSIVQRVAPSNTTVNAVSQHTLRAGQISQATM